MLVIPLGFSQFLLSSHSDNVIIVEVMMTGQKFQIDLVVSHNTSSLNFDFDEFLWQPINI